MDVNLLNKNFKGRHVTDGQQTFVIKYFKKTFMGDIDMVIYSSKGYKFIPVGQIFKYKWISSGEVLKREDFLCIKG